MALCEKCQCELVDFQAIRLELQSQVKSLNETLDRACDAGMEVDIDFIDCTTLSEKVHHNWFYIRSLNRVLPIEDKSGV